MPLLVSRYKHENIWAQIDDVKIWESSKQKSLRVVIDRDLSFNEYVSSLSKKAGKKLVLVVARCRVQYGKYFSSFSYFRDLFHEHLGE